MTFAHVRNPLIRTSFYLAREQSLNRNFTYVWVLVCVCVCVSDLYIYTHNFNFCASYCFLCKIIFFAINKKAFSILNSVKKKILNSKTNKMFLVWILWRRKFKEKLLCAISNMKSIINCCDWKPIEYILIDHKWLSINVLKI